MNNTHFSLLLSAMALTFAPACQKSSSAKAKADRQSTAQKEVKTLIEVDNTAFEIENNEEEQKVVVKF